MQPKTLVFVHFVLLLSECVTGSSTPGCRDNWVSFDGSCYLFAHHLMNFLDSVDFCRLYGTTLAHIETSWENAFLKDHIRYLQNGRWWIGLTDEIIERDWRWLDTDSHPTFTDWHPGEPNNLREENCAAFDYYKGYDWNDVPCSFQGRPICELNQAAGHSIFG